MMDLKFSEVFFQYLKGRCHGNQFSGKNGTKLPTPLHLSLCHSETEWDITTAICTILYENFMKCGPVTPELTWLICERQLRHGPKTGAF